MQSTTVYFRYTTVVDLVAASILQMRRSTLPKATDAKRQGSISCLNSLQKNELLWEEKSVKEGISTSQGGEDAADSLESLELRHNCSHIG